MNVIQKLTQIQRSLSTLSKQKVDKVQDFSPYVHKPVDYVQSYLGKKLTKQQIQILESLDKPPYRTLVRSANTQGKTYVAAARASYSYDTFNPGITLATAPTSISVRDLFFRELRNIRPTLEGFLPKATRLESTPNHFVHGFTAGKADSFQGRHSKHLGIIFDEATGVEQAFWDRAETMFESQLGHWWLACYNPNDVSSPPFFAEENGHWNTVVLSALDHPNILAELDGKEPVIPSAIRLATVLRRIETDCKEISPNEYNAATDIHFRDRAYRVLKPEFEAAILGRWPIAGSETIWTPALVDMVIKNTISAQADWPVVGGCDVARFGNDKTCIAIRKGLCLMFLRSYSGLNGPQIATKIKEALLKLCGDVEKAKKVPVNIDETGGYGATVIDSADGYNFIGISACEESPDIRFPNMRSWLWWNLRFIADSGACDFSRIDADEMKELKQELCAPHYHIDSANRRVVESKQQLKKRLKRSPDRADAVNLCYLVA